MEQVYQALYRKWRPRTFDDVVGQTHITDTLKSQVQSGRPSHAYLFTGTRGTGKTTCAKILARAVNCQNPVDGNPCNRCQSCVGIENGAILDVTEMDAASNNSVDNIRDLREEAVYAPAESKKRVYIVDEVHMLSGAAFNALLKIMEEPPEHLMFILATTELHKVPATILSRCQRFSFKRIRPEDIVERLQYIAGEEGLVLTQDGAALLARLSEGALRDALSLLDQCANLNRPIDQSVVLDTLGLAGNIKTAHIMKAIKGRNTAEVLSLLDELYTNGKDIKAILDELIALCRDLLICKAAPGTGMALLRGGYDQQTMQALSKGLPAARLVQILQILQETQGKLRLTAAPRLDAELCLIRLCDEGLGTDAAGLAARLARLEEQVKSGVVVAREEVPSTAPWEEAPPPGDWDAPPGEEAAPPPPPPPPGQDFWNQLAKAARAELHPPASTYIIRPSFASGVMEGNLLVVYVNDVSSQKVLDTPQVIRALEKHLALQTGKSLPVKVKLGKPRPAEPARSEFGLAPDDKLNPVLAMGSQHGIMDIIHY